jgi:tetratricopeptide (TPR) repeat protein
MAHYAMAHETPARSAFELALNLDPNAAWIGEINDRLAVLDADASKADGETLKRLEQMAEKRPNDVLLLTRLGEAYEGARKWDEALKHYRLAASTSPDAVPPQIGQARVLVANGDAAALVAQEKKVLLCCSVGDQVLDSCFGRSFVEGRYEEFNNDRIILSYFLAHNCRLNRKGELRIEDLIFRCISLNGSDAKNILELAFGNNVCRFSH